MSLPPQPMPQQMGGMRMPVLEEVKVMGGHFLLIGLILLSVYVSRIPQDLISLFKHPIYQVLGLFLVIMITSQYGWIHGILAALAFALIVSRAIRNEKEGMTNYIPMEVNALVIEDADSIVVPENHRWFLEKVMGERPIMIREKEVTTNAVQDMSERSMGSSTVTK